MEKLLKKLKKYSHSKIPMHMPGHKRNMKVLKNGLPYKIDITEVDGFDNLHNANGIIKESCERAQRLFESDKTYYCVNGSTGCILSAIRALTNFGDKIIVARNCHKSVFNAIEINGLKPIYVMPQFDESGICGSINPEEVKNILEKEDVKLFVLTSPTYEGVISDIKSISKICHKKKIPVVVDEAHGAHLIFEGKSAINMGADVVINSLHKTLPSLTQTAIINIKSRIVDYEDIEKELAVFNSSSPSYVLLASIDECINYLTKKGEKKYRKYLKNLEEFSNIVKKLKYLKVLCYGNDIPENHETFYDFDVSKIIISPEETNMTGKAVMEKLRRKFKIECEMSNYGYCLAMTSMFDLRKNIKKLAHALLKMDKQVKKRDKEEVLLIPKSKSKFSPFDCIKKEKKREKFLNCEGKVSGEYVWIYPPGIPLIVPGEVVDRKIIDYIAELSKEDYEINSTEKGMPKTINTIK